MEPQQPTPRDQMPQPEQSIAPNLANQTPASPQGSMPNQQPLPTQPLKKSNKTLLIVVAAVVVAFVLLVLGGLVMSSFRSAQKAARHTTVIAYMGAIADGRCDEAWKFFDSSSPYAGTKESHDVDCNDAVIKEIAGYIVDNPDNYTESTNDTGAAVYTHRIMAVGEEGDISVTVSNGKIYRISQ